MKVGVFRIRREVLNINLIFLFPSSEGRGFLEIKIHVHLEYRDERVLFKKSWFLL